MIRILSKLQNFAARAMQMSALHAVAILSFGVSSNDCLGQSIGKERKLARLEATYLFHLTKYVNWEKNQSNADFKIIVHGDDRFKFVETLKYVMNHSNTEKSFDILEFSNHRSEEALNEIEKGFQFLVLMKNSSMKAEQLSGLNKMGVIIVQGENLLGSSNAQIAFEHSQNRVRLLIDRKAIGENRNQLSSKLTELKSAVKVVNKNTN